MGKNSSWMQRLTEELDLASESVAGLPLVELCGDRRVLIENHAGVTRYGPEKICVKVSYGQLSVCGCDLKLAQMTRSQLVIRGRIDGISLSRRRDP